MSEKIKKLKVKYNNQRDNFAFPGIPGSSQCGYSSAAMLLSVFVPKYDNDTGVKELVEAMEPKVSKNPWLSNAILKLVPWAKGRLGALGDSYPIAITEILKLHKRKEKAVFVPGGGKDGDLKKAIDSGSPCLLSTMITGSGHFILVVGYIESGDKVRAWICHDPYGNANYGYNGPKGLDGAYVEYPWGWLEEKARKADPKGIGYRFSWVK